MTEIAQTPVEPVAERAQSTRTSDNPLVRAVGRVPLPLRAKLLIGFGVVGALLAIGYVLGFVALGQSNSRSTQLRNLQEQAAYDQLLLTDVTQIKQNVDYLDQFTTADESYVAGINVSILRAGRSLSSDAGCPRSLQGIAPRKGLTLYKTDPQLARKVCASPFGIVPSAPNIAYERQFAARLVSQLTALAHKTRARANELVAANNNSFSNSRNLLIGVGAGSLALALALALLLSSSVVVPLRRTRTRLAGIAAGDFSTPVEVPNRDEIGALAADVNSMSDELQRAYRELELTSEHKSQFLTNMSHELRTPLNAIIGFSEVLKEQMFGELNERQLSYVSDVLEAGKHLLSLINDLLDLAKIEAGRMELELSEVSIPELLRSAVSMHAEQAGRDGIELALNTEPDEIAITADGRRVRQILFNLLSNAVKFTPAKGRIDVSAHLENGQVAVAVADTGPGIPADELEAIFEEFEQTDVGRQAEGTGLGLPLSRRLVELHGGRLWAESEPGQGSTFRFTLPVQQEVS
jgi:signal transduction histidine kinase